MYNIKSHSGQIRLSSSLSPARWANSCTYQEYSLHQLSPYIGKLKSSIARDLILKYSKPGDLVVDMFCGSGTVPLEAACLGRRVFASDTSMYAITLTKGKLQAPDREETALRNLNKVINHVATLPIPDLRHTPRWIREFFHPRTLKEALQFVHVLKEKRQYFLLSSLLGILHHESSGFLSFPSSHLVPYLRSKKFPQSSYPNLYKYRPVAPRLVAKVERTLRRLPKKELTGLIEAIRQSSVENVTLPSSIDCVITSPPYMNALDYGRDNRLRLWFLGETDIDSLDRPLMTLHGFVSSVTALAKQLQEKVCVGGYCIFVVGEQLMRKKDRLPSEELVKVFATYAPKIKLCHIINDVIPDIRRSRRHTAGIKQENILVFRKS